jgi:hypothetical protein
MIVGFVGFIGSGKDTAADYLVNFHGYRRESFANTLKDAVSVVFGWDRTMLEGRTTQAREWREQPDEWWSKRLGKDITPRQILQYWGTDVLRQHFHDDIWIASLENKMRKTSDNIVISDVRFPNEIKAIHNAGGMVVRVKRGEDPVWYNDAVDMNAGDRCMNYMTAKVRMSHLKIHASETAWVGGDIDHTVWNNSSIDDLFDQIKNLVSDPLASTAA